MPTLNSKRNIERHLEKKQVFSTAKMNGRSKSRMKMTKRNKKYEMILKE